MNLAGMCTYGNGCFDRHVLPGSGEGLKILAEYKNKKCLYDENCRTPGCLFFHPWDGGGDGGGEGERKEIERLARELERTQVEDGTEGGNALPPTPTPTFNNTFQR